MKQIVNMGFLGLFFLGALGAAFLSLRQNHHWGSVLVHSIFGWFYLVFFILEKFSIPFFWIIQGLTSVFLGAFGACVSIFFIMLLFFCSVFCSEVYFSQITKKWIQLGKDMKTSPSLMRK